MNDKEFKEKIYNPYLEAWKIMKLVQYGQHFGTDEHNGLYMTDKELIVIECLGSIILLLATIVLAAVM